jgi:hypothetical protein
MGTGVPCLQNRISITIQSCKIREKTRNFKNITANMKKGESP